MPVRLLIQRWQKFYPPRLAYSCDVMIIGTEIKCYLGDCHESFTHGRQNRGYANRMSDFERYRAQRQRYERLKRLAADELSMEIERGMEEEGVTLALHETAEREKDKIALYFGRQRAALRADYDPQTLETVTNQLTHDADHEGLEGDVVRHALRVDRNRAHALIESRATRPEDLLARVRASMPGRTLGEHWATDDYLRGPDAPER